MDDDSDHELTRWEFIDVGIRSMTLKRQGGMRATIGLSVSQRVGARFGSGQKKQKFYAFQVDLTSRA